MILALALIFAEPRFTAAVPLRIGIPIGAAERGTNVGDMTYLYASLGLDVAWRWKPALAIVGGGRWGLGIPAVCFGPGSCIASAGRDVTLDAGLRFGTFPRVDVRFGWEWFGYVVSDGGVCATRSYDGPLVEIEVAAPLRLGKRTRFVPSIGGVAGSFTHAGLDTPIAHGTVAMDRRVHGWLTIGAALELAF